MKFESMFQKICIMIQNDLIIFYFVDDIVLCFRQRNQFIIDEIIIDLINRYIMKMIKELKWFFKINVIRNQIKKLLWLFQKTYVEKIVNQFLKSLKKRMPDTFMLINSSMQSNRINQSLISALVQLYRKKIDFIFFAFIIIRSNVAFAASKLRQRNINFTFENHLAADRVIKYLYFTRFLIIQYDTDESKKQTFVCANDASFADNSNRKSFQKFMIKLFNDFVSWKICKQFTIITSNTEVELLILFFIIKKVMFFIKLFCAIKLNLRKQLVIQCDNRQTIHLVNKENVKLNTRLKHVNIHNHWLRQKKKENIIKLK